MKFVWYVAGALALAGCMNQCDAQTSNAEQRAAPASNARKMSPDKAPSPELLQVKRLDASAAP